jgi:hypothetical protein
MIWHMIVAACLTLQGTTLLVVGKFLAEKFEGFLDVQTLKFVRLVGFVTAVIGLVCIAASGSYSDH